MLSERTDNDSRSTCEWVTSSLLEESDYCNTALTITTEIIPFLTWSSNCIMSHCILHLLSKTGFRYANYPGKKKRKKKWNSKGGEGKHAATGLASRRVTLSSCLVSERAWWFLREGRKKCRKGMLLSKMNRWQSLSVEICCISLSHVGAQ